MSAGAFFHEIHPECDVTIYLHIQFWDIKLIKFDGKFIEQVPH